MALMSLPNNSLKVTSLYSNSTNKKCRRCISTSAFSSSASQIGRSCISIREIHLNEKPQFTNNIYISVASVIVTEKAHFSNGGDSGGRSGGNNGKGTGVNGDSSSSNNGNGPKVAICSIMFGALLMLTWRNALRFPAITMENLLFGSGCLLGYMASRPNFGLNLLYLLCFLGSIKNIFFSPNFGYKGLVFACVGFAASLFGTAISNGLIMLRKKLDPNIETPSKAPPTILNALIWSAQMDFSNFKCQILNGIEIVLAKGVSVVFKGLVVILRSLSNVLGGVLFVTLARLMGSQKVLNSGKMDSEEDEKSGKLVRALTSAFFIRTILF